MKNPVLALCVFDKVNQVIYVKLVNCVVYKLNLHEDESESELLSCVPLVSTPWTIQSMEFFRPEYWSGLSLLQGIFPTQASNPGLPHWRRILYQLSHKESPRILEWVAYPFSRGSSQPKNWTGVSCVEDGFFSNWAIREAFHEDKTFQNVKYFFWTILFHLFDLRQYHLMSSAALRWGSWGTSGDDRRQLCCKQGWWGAASTWSGQRMLANIPQCTGLPHIRDDLAPNACSGEAEKLVWFIRSPNVWNTQPSHFCVILGYSHMCTQSFSCVQHFETPWTVAHQASLSMGLARILEWVAKPSSRGSSQTRDWTYISFVSCITGRFFTTEPPGKPFVFLFKNLKSALSLSIEKQRKNMLDFCWDCVKSIETFG